MPRLGFDPYCEGKWLPLQDEFTIHQVSTRKNFFYKSYKRILKIQKNQIFSETAQPILIAKVYVIEGTKEVLKKTSRTHSAHKKRMKKIIKFFK